MDDCTVDPRKRVFKKNDSIKNWCFENVPLCVVQIQAKGGGNLARRYDCYILNSAVCKSKSFQLSPTKSRYSQHTCRTVCWLPNH